MAAKRGLGRGLESIFADNYSPVEKVVTTTVKRYLLQKMNVRVFSDPVSLMNNICGVTEHLMARGIETLEVIPTRSGEKFIYGEVDSYRMYKFIENTTGVEWLKM